MAPMTIDEDQFATQDTLDLSKPQGTKQGLPVKQIPHLEYPRCVYRHPVEPYREVLHRNSNHEVVHRELVATEHRVHVCQNKDEHKQKLAEGWVEEPYIPQAPPDPTDHLYTKVADEVVKRIGDKPNQASEPNFDLIAAQKLLISRGYACEKPEDAADFVEDLNAKDRRSFLKDLAEFTSAKPIDKAK